ncbi:MAG: F0F1 ATP synthase subunit delta [Candidatus Omnitrophica bacterium]|nr:F0F1 ATP synthase subunit delta [Candidatus Omnitrophota bacterium]
MNLTSLIISFVILMVIICGILAFVLRWVLFSSTESSVRRLDDEVEKKREQQVELGKKMKQMDEELERKRAEMLAISQKMQNELEQVSKEKKEEIVKKARLEGEEIIEKAKQATEKMRKELEKEMQIHAVAFGMQIVNKVLSEKSKGIFDEVLTTEFLENLKVTDTTHIQPDVNTAELVTVNPMSEAMKSEISKVLKEKLNRTITLDAKTDPKIGGGVIIKFGSLALDGSIQSLIREIGVNMQTELEEQKV